jgi:hypothetical protein
MKTKVFGLEIARRYIGRLNNSTQSLCGQVA